MLKFVLLLLTVGLGAWAAPIPASSGDVPSHIVIVTPQAQVHLDPAGLKYESSAAFIHHLSPLARFAAPHHDETIVYVPAGAAASAPLIPFDPVSLARSTSAASELPASAAAASGDTKQLDQVAGQWDQIQNAIQMGAAAAASAAATAGSGLFPGLLPGLYPAPSTKDEQDAITPAAAAPATIAAQPLIASEARRYYAISPAVPHVVEFVHTPVFVAPVTAVRGRRLLPELQIVAQPAAAAASAAAPTPEESKPQALELKAVAAPIASAIAEQQPLKAEPLPAASAADPEKKEDFGRFLEANALKEEAAAAQPARPVEEPKPILDLLKADPELGAAGNIVPEAAAAPADTAAVAIAFAKALPKEEASVVEPQVPVVAPVAVPAAPAVVGAGEVPQLKAA